MMMITFSRRKTRWNLKQSKYRTKQLENIVSKPTKQYESSGGTMSEVSTLLGTGIKTSLYFKFSVSVSTPDILHHLAQYKDHMTHLNPSHARKPCRTQMSLQGTIISKFKVKVKIYVGHKSHTPLTLIHQKSILFQNHPT